MSASHIITLKVKVPTTPTNKANKGKNIRRDSTSSSSLDLSDEGGYTSLDNNTVESDEDEEDVEAAEEEHILSNERQQARRSPWPTNNDEHEDDNTENGEDGEEDEADDGDDEDEDQGDDDGTDEEGIPESTSWEGFSPEDLQVDDGGASPLLPSAHILKRRVRFDVPDSEDDDTETDEETAYTNGMFPDLFVDKSTLDPTFRREVDQAEEVDSDSSFWDHYGTTNPTFEDMNFFNGNDVHYEDLEGKILSLFDDDDSTPVTNPTTQNDMSTALSTPVPSPEKVECLEDFDEELDGYLSDGDTTDEEEPPPRPDRRKARREPLIEESEASDVEIIKRRRGQPRIGRFSIDVSKKPIAMIHPKTGKMIVFTNKETASLDLSPEQFRRQSAPVLANPGNFTMTALTSNMISSNTYGDFMNMHTAAPAEDWWFQDSNIDGFNFETMFDEPFDEASDSYAEYVDEDEEALKINDFLELGNDSSSSDDDENKDKDNGKGEDDIFRTPARPDSSGNDFFNHLFGTDSQVVGAFRKDQQTHQLLTRSKATRDSLAFSTPYYDGTLRGIKDGRLDSANVPISPLRRQKRNMPDLTSSPLASTKRKASSEQQSGHKRHRSMPDVGPLHL
ncbi:hypothetical protein GGR57DRAFT_170816 [Xylariaceae sp. FL1272]|nr:hypothetical protein GGR57DRAFT_170816 [Xylariaceae sp. FL1272]